MSTILNRFFNRHSLSPHQRRLVLLLLDGHNDEEIAQTIHTTPRTVKNMLHRIYDKTGHRGRLRLVVFLYKEAMK